MKIENIPANIKSKSLKEAKDEINEILGKLENQEGNLEDYHNDYLRLVQLNKYVDELFKKKFKEISQSKIND
jgi:exonuclease VII small subunit|tara:strand:+ start:12324 stop:12539 length:216 start_codon:yes stop_codon:yes gene_type:complete